ncbi:RNA polymerase sigma factor [Geodermatophilus sp. SYSU D01105]
MTDVEEAFGRFVAAERPALLAEALRLTGDPGRAEDAVQAALSRVHRRWGRAGVDPRAAASAALADAAGRGRGGGQVLESLDAAPPPPVVPGRWRLGTAEAVADAVSRSRRSRRLRAAAGTAVVAVAAVAGPLALRGPEAPAPAPAAAAPSDTAVLAEPTRGTLAGDRAYVDALRRLDWGPLVPPPEDERQVVLATDTPAGRVALVAGTVDEDLRGVWLTGPVGAAAGELVAHVPQHLGPGRPVSLLVGDPGAATLVVVAGRDDAVEVSPRLQVGPRGTVGRTYRPVDDVDGVAVVPVGTPAVGAALSVRVVRDGRPVHRSGVDVSTVPEPAAPPPGPLEPLRPSPVRPAPAAVAAALAEVAVPLGAEPAALEPQLLWSGPVPLEGVPGTVAVVVARSPGGGLVVTTWAAQVGPSGTGRVVPCGVSTPPGSADVAGLVVARVCDLSVPETEPSDDGRWLVVTAPAPAADAAVLDDRGAVLGTVALQDGSAVALLPEGGRTVRIRDAAGRAVTDVPVAAAPVTPFGDYGGGPVR